MKSLEKLIIEAQIITEPEAEVERVMQVCNACRYCEGFCAVFPAMTQRLAFGKADINYLANLCHNCGACLHACQYAPPHEFAINVPKAMAEVRLETYQHYAQPAAFGSLYRRADQQADAAEGAEQHRQAEERVGGFPAGEIVIARGHHGGGEAEHKTVEGAVVESAAQQGEGVIGFVAAFAMPAIEIFQRQRIL